MNKTEQSPPNIYIFCNLCGEKLGQVCMLSQDWSATSSWQGYLPEFRKHMKKEHGIKDPNTS